MISSLVVINIISTKGGVGKSSIALTLAAVLRKEPGVTVLYLDTDFSGTCILNGLDDSIKNDAENIDKKYLNELILEIPNMGRAGYDPKQYFFSVPNIDNLNLAVSNVESEELRCIQPFLDCEQASHYMTKRLCGLVGRCVREHPKVPTEDEVLVIVIDNAPSITGIARNILDYDTKELKKAMNLTDIDDNEMIIKKIDMFVTSPDRQDLAAIRTFLIEHKLEMQKERKLRKNILVYTVVNPSRRLKGIMHPQLEKDINNQFLTIDLSRKPIVLKYCALLRWFDVSNAARTTFYSTHFDDPNHTDTEMKKLDKLFSQINNDVFSTGSS